MQQDVRVDRTTQGQGLERHLTEDEARAFIQSMVREDTRLLREEDWCDRPGRLAALGPALIALSVLAGWVALAALALWVIVA